MSKFFSGIVGFSIGVFGCVITFPLATVFGWPSMPNINIHLMTNITIAGAAVIAAYIHYSSHKQQKVDRRWDINKDVLLALAHSLHDANRGIETEIGNMKHGSEHHIETNPNVWNTLDESISNVLYVYSSLIDEALIDSIREYQKNGDKITMDSLGSDSDNIYFAHRAMLLEGRILLVQLQEFIGEVSGVQEGRKWSRGIKARKWSV
jgi:hypothetical protein